MTIKERAAAATEMLKQAYPDAICALHYTKDYELLFATRLSAQCTDARVNIVTKELFAKFPALEDYAAATVEEIEAVIKTCGLFHTKARDLKAAAVMLLSDFGGKVPDTMEDLLKLPGIGRKTANLILGDIYGKPVEAALRKILDPAESSDFCHRLVHHGREVCTARAPKCQNCCLAAICRSFPIGK